MNKYYIHYIYTYVYYIYILERPHYFLPGQFIHLWLGPLVILQSLYLPWMFLFYVWASEERLPKCLRKPSQGSQQRVSKIKASAKRPVKPFEDVRDKLINTI